MPRTILRHCLSALLATVATLAMSSAAVAENKIYTVTAPDGVTLAVQETGNPQGPAVVLIHGLLGSRLDWDAQLNSVDLQRYRMITYDLRGHGLSAKPTQAQAYSDGRRWADDLATVIKSSHADHPVLVGWSLGGAVISNYLAAYGDRQIAGTMYVDGVIEFKADQIASHPPVYRDIVSPDLKTHLDAERAFLALCFHTQPDQSLSARLLANAAMASWDMQNAVMSMTIAAAEARSRYPCCCCTANATRSSTPAPRSPGRRNSFPALRPFCTPIRATHLSLRSRPASITIWPRSSTAPQRTPESVQAREGSAMSEARSILRFYTFLRLFR
jgi:non-heme chloroperoxidase